MRFLLTGKPGSGKSTLVQELITGLREKKKIAGIVTPEIRQHGIRKGFKIIDLASGKEAIMSHVSFPSPKIGKYGVSIKNIDSIIIEFEKSLANAEIIVIDEIGKMEFFSSKFKQLLEKIFSTNKTIIAVVHRDFAQKFKEKGQLIQIKGNIKESKERILKKLAYL